MQNETTRQPSIWRGVFVGTLLAAGAAGVIRWQFPLPAEATCQVQVPPATDLGDLCGRADVRAAAKSSLLQNPTLSDSVKLFEEASLLTGKLCALKLPGSGRRATSPGVPTNGSQTSCETWQLTYRSTGHEHILPELEAFLTSLQQQVHETLGESRGTTSYAFESRREELEDQLLNNQLALSLMDETESSTAEPLEIDLPETDLESSIVTLKLQAETLEEELQAINDDLAHRQAAVQWVLHEFQTNGDLAAIAAQIPNPEVQEVVMDLASRAAWSRQLTQMNELEGRLSVVYGERHPRLKELRDRFQETLSKLGGWEQIIDGKQLGELLVARMDELVEPLREQAEEGQGQLQALQDQLAQFQRRTDRRQSLATQKAELEAALSAHLEAQSTGVKGSTQSFVVVQPPTRSELPWFMNDAILSAVIVGIGGLAGIAVQRWRTRRQFIAEISATLSVQPSFTAQTSSPLDLAQRRALRQARLRQAYA